jgi:gamma-glutamylcyclotransferase
VYELTAADEHDLDLYEGPTYAKKVLPVLLTETKSEDAADIVEMLIYIDVLRKIESYPRKEYIYRMNMGIADALEQGVPQDYIDKYLRPFIPSPDNANFVNES